MNSEAQSVLTETQPQTAPAAAPAIAIGLAFEELLQELEALVTQLESGDLPLDEALRTFERGVRLTRECQTALSSAQQKVQVLLQRGGTLVVEEFDRAAVDMNGPAAGSDNAP